jgi:hypothetical protein
MCSYLHPCMKKIYQKEWHWPPNIKIKSLYNKCQNRVKPDAQKYGLNFFFLTPASSFFNRQAAYRARPLVWPCIFCNVFRLRSRHFATARQLPAGWKTSRFYTSGHWKWWKWSKRGNNKIFVHRTVKFSAEHHSLKAEITPSQVLSVCKKMLKSISWDSPLNRQRLIEECFVRTNQYFLYVRRWFLALVTEGLLLC